MKLALWPSMQEISYNNGIGRVVHMQHELLPKYGVEIVTNPFDADLIACHTQQYTMPRVDVLHLHGMYWTGEPHSGKYNAWHQRANHEIAAAARRALAITVPSEWVAMPFKRDMRLVPTIIGHGIHVNEWQRGPNRGYVLWNKNRASDVCDPTPALKLAEAGLPVLSTFAPPGKNVPQSMTLIGALDDKAMRDVVQSADVYLATVKETFGIGTLEALASGVPVLGYNWGGTAALVQHKVTGYLAVPHNIDDLLAGYAWIKENYSMLSDNARKSAQSHTWDSVMKQYVRLYEQTAGFSSTGKVSIVITNYNYAGYVAEAVESALAQRRKAEVIVVDDGSTDNSRDVLEAYKGRVKLILKENGGVAEARNVGIAHATGDYIVCLDADDRIDPAYVEVLARELDEDRGLGIVYSGLGLLGEDGKISPNAWPPEFSWTHMTHISNPPASCIHCAAMFRKRMWERAGGYKQEYAPGEDTEFWVRGLSVGFTARKVTEEFLFHYRTHSGSASRTKVYKPINDWHPWMLDKQYPLAAPSISAPPVRSYSEPQISVIIPVGKKHEAHLATALDSLIGQTYREWEAVVILDGVDEPHYIKRYPFVKVVSLPKSRGTGAARNAGLEVATAPFCVFLDADDLLHPSALEDMLREYAGSGGRYIYTNWQESNGGNLIAHTSAGYVVKDILKQPLHAVTVLMSTEQARQIKFDPELKGLEDWDFFIRCAIAGIHGKHLPMPLLIVRTDSGTRTRAVMKRREDALKEVAIRYIEYRQGEKKMAGCCGGNGTEVMTAKAALGLLPPSEEPGRSVMSDRIRVEYIGDKRGSVPYGGPGHTPSGRVYRGGDNVFDKYHDADPADVDWLEGTGFWRRVARPVPASLPQPEAPVIMEVEQATDELLIDPSAPEEKPTEKKTRKRGKRSVAPATDSSDV